MKKTMFLAAMVSLCIFFGAAGSDVHAAWYLCTVEGIGTAGSSVMIQLTDTAASPAFSKKWFTTNTANATETNRITAATLTAMSLEKNVSVNVNDMAPTFPIINNFYLLK